MVKRLLDRLRGARRIELFAALALAALLALMLIDFDGSGDAGETRTALESRMERVLQRIEGAGRVSAMITQDENGAVTGVLIVADGMTDMLTYLRLQRAVSALLDVEADRIEIIGGSFGGEI